MTQAKTRVLTAHVPLPLAERVDRAAARLDRSRGWIIKQALAAWVEQEEQRERSAGRRGIGEPSNSLAIPGIWPPA